MKKEERNSSPEEALGELKFYACINCDGSYKCEDCPVYISKNVLKKYIEKEKK